ncbi:lactoylglutathione lyase [Xanthomonas citri pv. citri]
MLHHVSLGVRAIDASATFYDAALGALGDVRVWSDLEPGTRDQAVGYGRPGGEGCLALERVMSVEVSAKRPVARRDKACNAVSARHRALPGGLAFFCFFVVFLVFFCLFFFFFYAAPAPHR